MSDFHTAKDRYSMIPGMPVNMLGQGQQSGNLLHTWPDATGIEEGCHETFVCSCAGAVPPGRERSAEGEAGARGEECCRGSFPEGAALCPKLLFRHADQ